LEGERIYRRTLEKEIALRKKAEEKYDMETIKWKQLLEKEQACTHTLEANLAVLRKQVDDDKVEIMRLKLLSKEEGAKRHKLVRDKYSDIKVGFSFAHWM
jgi:hypothetical protein